MQGHTRERAGERERRLLKLDQKLLGMGEYGVLLKEREGESISAQLTKGNK